MKKFWKKEYKVESNQIRSRRWWLALPVSLCIIGMMLSVTASAENGSAGAGLCEHHTEHTAECGYEAPVSGRACTHVHDEACGYAENAVCGHVHDEACGYVEAFGGSPCTFVCEICKAEAGSGTDTEAGTDTEPGSDTEPGTDTEPGMDIEPGSDLDTEPDLEEEPGSGTEPEEEDRMAIIQAVQELIDVLPDAEDITEENFDIVSGMLDIIDTAKEVLTDEEREALDFTRYDAAAARMMELMGQPGAGEAAVIPVSGIDVNLIGNNGAAVKTINLNAAALRPDSTWSSGGNQVYFGVYEGNPVSYRVLSAPSTQTGSEGYLLLDCNIGLRAMSFSVKIIHVWTDSDVRDWLNGTGVYGDSVFSDIERDAIARTELVQQSEYQAGSSGYTYLDYSSEDYVFCLSAAEAEALYTDGTEKIQGNGNVTIWWTRSYMNNGSNVGVVEYDGCLLFMPAWDSNIFVSPALNVKLSSVLFASESGADKSAVPAMVSDSNAKQWKLTLLDSSKTVKVADGQRVDRQDAEITVPYTYTGSGVSQISVMITDKEYTQSDAQVLCYGALQDVTIGNQTGTGSFTLPAELTDKTCGTDYYAYIIAEKVNDATKTDYASEPVQITIPSQKINDAVTGQDTEDFDDSDDSSDNPLEESIDSLSEEISDNPGSGDLGTAFTIGNNILSKKDDVPKTGDDTTGIWLFILAGLSGAGVILTGKRNTGKQ